jgi:hypothetical protein
MNILDALSYPIRRSGWMMILTGAVFSVILSIMQFAPMIGIGVSIFSAGYFGAFYLSIISATMTEQDEMPDWPSFTSFSDDILSPFLQLVGLVFIAFGPVIAIAFLAGYHEASWLTPSLIAAIAFGCFYFPMAVLALQAFGSVGAALPHVVFPAVMRSLPGYLLAVVGLVLVVTVCGIAYDLTAKVPFVGCFFSAAIALYSLIFQARLIGLIYRAKSEALRW